MDRQRGMPMRRSLAALAALLALIGTAHASGPGLPGVKRLAGISYDYRQPPEEGYAQRGDPKRQKLLDGRMEHNDNGCMWVRLKRPVVVTFDLRGRYLVDRVVAKGYAGGKSWPFDRMLVHLDDGKGFGLSAVDAWGPGPSSHAKTQPARLAVQGVDRPARRVRIELPTSTGYLWLCEVEIYGRPLPADVQRQPERRAADAEVYATDFGNTYDWSWGYREGDHEYGKGRPRCHARLKDNCLILGTSNTGATLLRPVPRDFVLETRLKVSHVKAKPDMPDARNPGANLYVRKTEQDNVWRAYAVRLWFRKQRAGGLLLIRKCQFNVGANKAVEETSLVEKRWPLHMDTWYDVRIRVQGNQIAVWIDGEEIATATDKGNSFPQGGVALSGNSWPSYAFFRGLRIRKAE